MYVRNITFNLKEYSIILLMIKQEIDKEYEVDPSTITLGSGGFIGKTFDGRDAVLVTSASLVLSAELSKKLLDARSIGYDIPVCVKREGLAGDIGPEKIRQAINNMIGRIGVLPKGFEYVLGPIYGTVSPEDQDYYEMINDWGIYKVRRASFLSNQSLLDFGSA